MIAAGATTLVDLATDGGPAEELRKALLTVAVNQAEAQKLVYGPEQRRQITFGLLNEESEVDRSDPGVTAENLFD